MSEINIVSDAKVMPKGQVTIPKKIRDILGVSNGDRVTFVVENGEVKVLILLFMPSNAFRHKWQVKEKKLGFSPMKPSPNGLPVPDARKIMHESND